MYSPPISRKKVQTRFSYVPSPNFFFGIKTGTPWNPKNNGYHNCLTSVTIFAFHILEEKCASLSVNLSTISKPLNILIRDSVWFTSVGGAVHTLIKKENKVINHAIACFV